MIVHSTLTYQVKHMPRKSKPRTPINPSNTERIRHIRHELHQLRLNIPRHEIAERNLSSKLALKRFELDNGRRRLVELEQELKALTAPWSPPDLGAGI